MFGLGRGKDDGGVNPDVVEDEGHMQLPTFWAEPQSDAFLKAAAEMDRVGDEETGRTDAYRKYSEYYDGKHLSELTARAKQYLLNEANIDYAENVCDLVVDAMADRLTILGFSKEKVSDTVLDKVGEVWRFNNMDEVHKTAISRTLELGDGMLIVDWDAEAKMPEIHFNHPEMVKVEYAPDNPQKKLYAVKVWKDDKVGPVNPGGEELLRMNVYFENRIERYYTDQRDAANWNVWFDEGDEHWPVPWTRDNEPDPDNENGRGIAVFHLKNKARGNQYGVSELRKAIPLQNSLNKLWLDLFEVADQQGYPQRYATGLGKNERVGSTSTGAGSILTSANPETKFGQFQQADLNALVNIIDTRYRTIAGTTYTPIHMLVLAKGILSGEALKKSEAGLVAKVKDRHAPLGNEFSNIMMMCLALLVDNGVTIQGFDYTKTKVDPLWCEAENVDEAEKMEVAEAKRRVGVPLRKVLQELGYENVDELMEMVKDELEQAQALRSSNEEQQPGGAKATATTDADRNADGKKTPAMQKQQLKSQGRDVEQ